MPEIPIKNKKSVRSAIAPPIEKSDSSLQHLAFEHSLHPHLITSVAGKIVLANKAACVLLGYTQNDLLTKNRAAIFDLSKTGFEVMLAEQAKQNAFPTPISVIRKNGKRLLCETTALQFNSSDNQPMLIISLMDMSRNIRKQIKIDIAKEKIVADNISMAAAMQKIIDIKKEKRVVDDIIEALVKSDARLAANNEWKKHIGLTSYDVMWDWEMGNKQIYVSDSMKEVFGYSLNNTMPINDFWKFVLEDQVREIKKRLSKTLISRKKAWNASFMFKCQDGTLAAATCRASIVRNKDGKAIRLIGALQDVSRLHELEQQLKEQITQREELSEILQVASKLSFDGRWDWNLLTNDVNLGDGFHEIFGYDLKKNKRLEKKQWFSYHHPADRQRIEEGLHQAILSSVSHWEDTYRFIKGDGSIAKVINRATIIRDSSGKACRMVGAMQDVSKQHKLEYRLEQEILSRNKQIAEATEEAKQSVRSDLGRELHDNVNQLLGAAKLYLEMGREGGVHSKELLGKSSDYTITAIAEIRKLTKGLTDDIIQNVGLCMAIEAMTDDTTEVSAITIKCDLSQFIEKSVDNNFKLNIFRIVQEQFNNILKHAKASKITIALSQNKSKILLTIKDNGIGFDTDQQQNGIGLSNIKSRAAAYNGTANFISAPNKGCSLAVNFPFPVLATK